MGETEKALKSLEAAVSKFPDSRGSSEATWFYLGSVYECAGRSAEALDAYRKCVNLCKGSGTRKPESFPWREASERISVLDSSDT